MRQLLSFGLASVDRAIQHVGCETVELLVQVVQVLPLIGVRMPERRGRVQPLAEGAGIVAAGLLDRRRAVAGLDRLTKLRVSCLVRLKGRGENLGL